MAVAVSVIVTVLIGTPSASRAAGLDFSFITRITVT
jgi:hypothetical protein